MEKKPGRRAATILVVIVGLLVTYLLSFGPAAIFLSSADSDMARYTFEVAYERPIQYFPRPLANLLSDWAYLCGDIYSWFYKLLGY